ncbi:hypothetical protein JQC92_04435 [Shewanella sp. 202IG2-18]|uniref:hypothetical protein n=1 Tax=Parashewanella hymeniacidonis TaxID=2807618 RepID=UPI00196131B1|nr:hypothetical protein [Parashewanella hymeniacidonis]MBM7071289.1 hypothetical protein [Parashewanella hymeniacidonis]
MGFFKSLFSKTEEVTSRELTQPDDLIIGDMITLDDSFALPSQLKGKQLKVEAVNTYEYEHRRVTEWQLKGIDNQAIFLTLDKDDEVYLALSIKVSRDKVEQLFDMESFSQIFEEPGEAELSVIENHPIKELSQWLGQHYRQTSFADFGYYHPKDYRKSRPSQSENENQGDPFESYQLMDDTESYALDIEVYEGGETEVSLVLYRPVTDIREYWPI